MTRIYDIAVLGSGFGGSIMAMVARRIGLSVILLERGTHPRFAIGESTSPLTNLLIEQLANRYDLPRLIPLTAWGPWQKTYPEIVGGMKRGFTYYHHTAGKPFERDPSHSNQLMVAASPNDEISDTHWLRSDVDQFLMQEAVAAGVNYLDQTTLTGIQWSDGVAHIAGEHNGEALGITAKLVIDATGPRGFLSRSLNLAEVEFEGYPATQTLFSHFTGVRRTDEMPEFEAADSEGPDPPYFHDDSALHHIFEGGWMWVLRFHNGVTSAGIAVTDEMANRLNLSEGEAAWRRFLDMFPSVKAQFAYSRPTRPFVYSPRLSYRCSTAAGHGWAMLPSAAAFIDPLFSTGFPLTLLGIERLAAILEESWGSPKMDMRLLDYGKLTLKDADWTARFIGASYACFDNFQAFADLSMFYFAAASYNEMARRLNRKEIATRFLGSDRMPFAERMAACEDLAGNRSLDSNDFRRSVCDAIEEINVAGLCDSNKHNWYGVDLADVERGAAKLGFTTEEMRHILATAPWAKAACRVN